MSDVRGSRILLRCFSPRLVSKLCAHEQTQGAQSLIGDGVVDVQSLSTPVKKPSVRHSSKVFTDAGLSVPRDLDEVPDRHFTMLVERVEEIQASRCPQQGKAFRNCLELRGRHEGLVHDGVEQQ